MMESRVLAGSRWSWSTSAQFKHTRLLPPMSPQVRRIAAAGASLRGIVTTGAPHGRSLRVERIVAQCRDLRVGLLPAADTCRGFRRRPPRPPLSGSTDLGLASTPRLRLRLARAAAGEAPVEEPPSKPVVEPSPAASNGTAVKAEKPAPKPPLPRFRDSRSPPPGTPRRSLRRLGELPLSGSSVSPIGRSPRVRKITAAGIGSEDCYCRDCLGAAWIGSSGVGSSTGDVGEGPEDEDNGGDRPRRLREKGGATLLRPRMAIGAAAEAEGAAKA
ncbi:hypothetical protein E2562_035783 [Oryza meyeriana var. granulata]|uniref:Uncharacterized protein n=1 Tax=Oryza meyeriana var. granulata TaxID=110450 RepID=A0A6G1CL12_9ORYZ|nr:hypothetical protein E2562_035783 [Oryza meyeriana var. granulata]